MLMMMRLRQHSPTIGTRSPSRRSLPHLRLHHLLSHAVPQIVGRITPNAVRRIARGVRTSRERHHIPLLIVLVRGSAQAGEVCRRALMRGLHEALRVRRAGVADGSRARVVERVTGGGGRVVRRMRLPTISALRYVRERRDVVMRLRLASYRHQVRRGRSRSNLLEWRRWRPGGVCLHL